MSLETTKALPRRLLTPGFASDYFVGTGIDIGSGEDPLINQIESWPYLLSCYPWDWPSGDAQEMPGLTPETFSFVYSSHCLEHVRDPAVALARWWELVKPGGHLIVQVPDEDLYEQGVWPSTWNPDHKSSFAVGKSSSWCPASRNLDDLLRALPHATLLHCTRQTAHFRSDWPRQDQTKGPAECAIEAVARKDLPRNTNDAIG